MPTKPSDRAAPTPDEGAHETGALHYKVLIAGISRPGLAPAYQGEVVEGATLGDDARIQKLLELRRIEPVDD